MGWMSSLKAAIGNWTGTAEHGRSAGPAASTDIAQMSLRERSINARYEAAGRGSDIAGYWANADALDADSANSRAVRSVLVSRSRYEDTNNGYYAGIANTYATDCIGCGPKLRMQSGSPEFDRAVETEWARWAKAIKLRQKLLTMAHAKHVDGEGIGIARSNPKVKHRVQLDVVLYETEQCQTPMLPFAVPGYVDGIKFDEFGNPEHYDILKHHPGGQWSHAITEPERVRARYVLHWFKQTRPGQHRGIPECAATMNVGVAARRWREATVGAAEKAANFAVVMTTQMPPNAEGVEVASPFTTVPLAPNTMTALPLGSNIGQVKAEHPNSTHEAFVRSTVGELARPKSMPLNKALCDSSRNNYASGRLDHLGYYAELDSDRDDCDAQVLDPLFEVWFEEAVLEFGWKPPADYAVSWDWPKHAVIDEVSQANANKTKLQTGAITLGSLYADNGEDFEEKIERMAAEYGVEVDDMRKILLIATFNPTSQQASYMTAEANASKAEGEEGRDANAATAA